MEIHKKNDLSIFLKKNQVIEQAVGCRVVKEEVSVVELQPKMLPGRIAGDEQGYMPPPHCRNRGMVERCIAGARADCQVQEGERRASGLFIRETCISVSEMRS